MRQKLITSMAQLFWISGYFVANTNQSSIQDELFNSLSFVLTQLCTSRMREQLALFRTQQNTALMHFYEAQQIILSGDAQVLTMIF